MGEKTARQLLAGWKSLDEIFQHIDEITPGSLRVKLQSDRNSAYLSRELVSLKNDVPVSLNLEELFPRPPQKLDLIKLYGELNFKGLLEALRREWGDSEGNMPSAAPASPIEMKIIKDQKALAQIVEILEKHGEFALYVDVIASNTLHGRINGIAISFSDHMAHYIAFPQPDEGGQTRLAHRHLMNTVWSLLDRSEIGKTGHDLKGDGIVLRKHGMHLNGCAFDTMLASYLLDPGRQVHDLFRLAAEHLEETLTLETPARSEEPATKNEEPSASLPPDAMSTVAAACRKAEMIGRLAPILKNKLREAKQEELFLSLELPLIPVLAGMESRGILVDAGRLESLALDFEKAMTQKAATIYELAKEEFNIQSPKQLAYILFEKLGLPVVKRMKSGPSTDSSVLEELLVAHPIVEHLLSYRSLAKLKGTYADVLPRLINPETRRIHTSFNQTVTATGRLSSSEPNLQNIPIRSEEGRKIREAFIPSPGHLLLSADYSQIELRILAHLSRDEHLLEAFHSDGDVHRQTAAEMFNIPQHEVTSEMRRQAKTINFGIIYGMGAFGLARRLGISRQMAKGVIERYFNRYRGVRQYIETVVQSAREKGYAETILGRRRSIPELASRNHNIRQQGERLAINSPIQGSAADLIKKAMIDVDLALREQGLGAAMLLQVHDELVFEVPEGVLDVAKEIILQRMEQAGNLSVPLKIDLSWGENWAQAHP